MDEGKVEGEVEEPRRRREDDERFLAVVGRDLAYLWSERMGLIARTLAVLTTIGTVLGGVWVGGTAYGAMRAEFRGLPDRVGVLESRFRAHIDTTTRENQAAIEANTARIDTLEQTLQTVREEVKSVRAWLIRLEGLAASNHCWIRVAAGEESRFNCSATPEGAP